MGGLLFDSLRYGQRWFGVIPVRGNDATPWQRADDLAISSSTDFETYDDFLLQTFTALWVIIVTGIALIFELIYFVLRFLNIRSYNNCYTLYGTLDIIRYVLLVICLLIGCAGYVEDVTSAGERADRCDEHSEAAEVDTTCEELRDRATIYILMAVSCGVAAGVVICSSCFGEHLPGNML